MSSSVSIQRRQLCWRRHAIIGRYPAPPSTDEEEDEDDASSLPQAPPPLPTHVPSAAIDAMEQGEGMAAHEAVEEEDGPVAPPPLPAHTASAALVVMEEGGRGEEAGGSSSQMIAPRPWAHLRAVSDEAAAELEGVVGLLEAGQRRIEALGAWG